MLRGKTEPRIWTPPLRPLTPDTTLGYDVIEFAEEQLGVTLPWEKWLFIHGLEIIGDFEGNGTSGSAPSSCSLRARTARASWAWCSPRSS